MLISSQLPVGSTRLVQRILADFETCGVVGEETNKLLGYLAAWAGGHYHFIHLSAEVYSIDTLPFAPRPFDGLIVSALYIGVALIATLYPSWSASRILPAEALRYE